MIYFLASPTTNSVKIGHTRVGIEARFAQILPYSPVPLELVATVEGDTRLETALHAEFDALRLHNEWFKLEGELRALVRRIIVDGPSAMVERIAGLPARPGAFKHGTASAYTGRRCRCAKCKKAWSEYQGARRRGDPSVLRWRPGRRGRPPKDKKS